MYPSSEIHFWHIPKTAGTSLAGMIRRAYPADECIPAHTARELAAMRPEQVSRYRCYTGHFFSLLELLAGRSLPTVTILRDPVQQTLSLLRHCQRYVSSAGLVAPLTARLLPFLWEKMPAQRASIEKLWCPVLMNNFQTRVLGSEIRLPEALGRNFYGLTYPFMEQTFCDPRADMDALYARAVKRLRSMAVVGTAERFSESVGCIFRILGVMAPTALPHENVSESNWRPSAEFLDLVERQNVYDRKLHSLAVELLDRNLAN